MEFIINNEIFIPKTKIGKKVGSISIDNNKFLPRSPKVRAAPIVDMKLIAGVPIIMISKIHIDELNDIPRGIHRIGVKIIIGRHVITQ